MIREFLTVGLLLGSGVSGVMHEPKVAQSTRWLPADTIRVTTPAEDRDAAELSQESFGVATATFPVNAAAGKRIRFSGFIKTEEVLSGWAGLWWRVDGADRKPLGFDNMHSRGAKGTSNWREFSIELTVDSAATNINFGALLTGDGKAWFDDLKVEIDGKRFPNGNLFDFGFEFEPYPTRGFSFGGRGYNVGVTDRVQRGGQKSLQMIRMPGA